MAYVSKETREQRARFERMYKAAEKKGDLAAQITITQQRQDFEKRLELRAQRADRKRRDAAANAGIDPKGFAFDTPVELNLPEPQLVTEAGKQRISDADAAELVDLAPTSVLAKAVKKAKGAVFPEMKVTPSEPALKPVMDDKRPLDFAATFNPIIFGPRERITVSEWNGAEGFKRSLTDEYGEVRYTDSDREGYILWHRMNRGKSMSMREYMAYFGGGR